INMSSVMIKHELLWIQFDGLSKVTEGLVVLAFGSVDIRPQGVRKGLFRIHLDCFGKCRDGLLQFPLFSMCYPAFPVSLGVFGRISSQGHGTGPQPTQE